MAALTTEYALERNKSLKPTETELFYFYQLRPFPWDKVDNFWQDFLQMSAFLSSDIFCPLVPPLARCLKFKGRRKSKLLIWSCFKKFQNLSTSAHFTVLDCQKRIKHKVQALELKQRY